MLITLSTGLVRRKCYGLFLLTSRLLAVFSALINVDAVVNVGVGVVITFIDLFDFVVIDALLVPVGEHDPVVLAQVLQGSADPQGLVVPDVVDLDVLEPVNLVVGKEI